METFTLDRSGQAPLQFTGELLSESDGLRQANKEHTRFHNVSIFRTQGGKYVLHICYETRWQGEVGYSWAVTLSQPWHVAKAIEEYDPTSHVAGYPPHPTYEKRQQRLLEDIRSRWQQQVSDILCDDRFAEKVS